MKKLLSLKHWQLFLLLIGIPLVLESIAIGLIIATKDPTALFMVVPIMMIGSTGVFFGWFWALGTNLHAKLPLGVKMNLTRFKVFLLIPAIYIGLISIFIFGAFKTIPHKGEMNWQIIPVIFPLHFFAMFCIFYCLYFIAKEIKAVELQRPVTFSDFAGEFLLIWFYPIGIWIIQPRINKLFRPASEL